METRAQLAFALALAASAGLVVAQPEAIDDTVPANDGAVSDGSAWDAGSGFLLSDERLHDDPEILWEGFLTGQTGFDHFYLPVSTPIYFESPINDTRISLLYLRHEFPEGSQLAGGDLNVFAVQARAALTERLGFIATKDGYSFLDADALPEAEGWNDLALGLKYVVLQDRESDTVATVGVRYMAESGSDRVLQGNVSELSPFISVAKGFDELHLMGNLTWRAPLDSDEGNHIIQWSLHGDYEVVEGFAPMIELNGLHYVSDGDLLPLSVGGLDYANIGSSDVSGSTVIWAEVGAGAKLTPHVELAATYGFALTNADADIMDDRITALLHFKW